MPNVGKLPKPQADLVKHSKAEPACDRQARGRVHSTLISKCLHVLADGPLDLGRFLCRELLPPLSHPFRCYGLLGALHPGPLRDRRLVIRESTRARIIRVFIYSFYIRAMKTLRYLRFPGKLQLVRSALLSVFESNYAEPPNTRTHLAPVARWVQKKSGANEERKAFPPWTCRCFVANDAPVRVVLDPLEFLVRESRGERGWD